MSTSSEDRSATPPAGVTVRGDLDGRQIALPGLLLSWRDMARTILLLSAFPVVLILGMGIAMGAVPLALLIALVLPVLFLPFFGLGWLRARGTPIMVTLQPHRIEHRYLAEAQAQSVPLSAIRGVEVPDDDSTEPQIRLVVDWSSGRIECPPLARGKPLVWRLRDRSQAEWLAGEIRAAVAGQGSAEEVPEALRELVVRPRQGAEQQEP